MIMIENKRFQIIQILIIFSIPFLLFKPIYVRAALVIPVKIMLCVLMFPKNLPVTKSSIATVLCLSLEENAKNGVK